MRKICLGTVLAAVAFSAPAYAGIVNGDFESGDSGFTSSYGDVSAGVTQSSCFPPAVYAVNANPNNCHSSWASYGPHSGSLQLIVNGAEDSTLAVWSETLNVTPGTIYNFAAWGASSYSESPANLSFKINGVEIGTLQLPSTTGEWTQFGATWDSLALTSATLSIYDLDTDYSGNDFTLDDISFEPARTTQATPEPMTLVLFGSGLAGLGRLRRRRKAKA